MKAFTAFPWIGGSPRFDSRRVKKGSFAGAKAEQVSSLTKQNREEKREENREENREKKREKKRGAAVKET
ncbi:MAG TPA: hypothetical protein VFD64_12895 [Gemmatimonadaceae bacterium]|nr:hypothetical protein [Gemmatimonadaceae bacterium]